jgi:hypothetical protein
MSVSRLERILFRFHGAMAVYGFTRGYRSIPDSTNYGEKSKVTELNKEVIRPLFSSKITNGLMNGLLYGVFFLNIPMTMNLMNRIEIKVCGLDKEKYSKSYEEWTGTCYDTI